MLPVSRQKHGWLLAAEKGAAHAAKECRRNYTSKLAEMTRHAWSVSMLVQPDAKSLLSFQQRCRYS
jgi:hypothetical protein